MRSSVSISFLRIEGTFDYFPVVIVTCIWCISFVSDEVKNGVLTECTNVSNLYCHVVINVELEHIIMSQKPFFVLIIT